MSDLTDKASAKAAEVREKAEETLHAAKERASKAATDVRAKASDVAATAKARASDAAATAREKSVEAVAATKRGARIAAEKTATGIEQNPLAVLVGGIALGAIAAALLPRTAREDSAVGAVGKKVRATASDAVKAARATGKDQLDALGVNADTARDQFKDIFGKITKAATSAAEAAGESLKKR